MLWVGGAIGEIALQTNSIPSSHVPNESAGRMDHNGKLKRSFLLMNDTGFIRNVELSLFLQNMVLCLKWDWSIYP